MAPEQMILPAIGTLALGTALLVPLRDDRLGRRATVTLSETPLRPNFAALLEPGAAVSGTPAECEPADGADLAINPSQSDATSPVICVPDLRAKLETLGTRVRRLFSIPADEKDDNAAHADPEPDPDEVTVVRPFGDTFGELLHIETKPGNEPNVPIEPGNVQRDELASHHVAVTASGQMHVDRIVPLTRMPLRPQAPEITWPALLSPPRSLATESQRLAFLASSVRSSDPSMELALRTAYREEEPKGRVLALRALQAGSFADATDIFVDALHLGTDDERSLAIDALLAAGQRDAVAFAFDDRVDAVAAQAALGYVASYIREDYVSALAPYCDRRRIETLLGLLAGIVE